MSSVFQDSASQQAVEPEPRAPRTTPLVAIGLDAVDPRLLQRWLDQGLLPHLDALRRRGGFGLVNNVRYYRTETSWVTFLTGATPKNTGEWGHLRYDADDYRSNEGASYTFDRFPPFYAGLQDRRVAIFDAPLARPVSGVSGLQLMGWGTETNQCLRTSEPKELMGAILDRYGSHPMFAEPASRQESPDGEVLGYRIPSAYDVEGLRRLKSDLCAGARQRALIMKDLMARESRDLFLGVFSETHTASHLLWHLSQPHPLREMLTRKQEEDPLLAVFQAVDEGVGEVLTGVPDSSRVVVFSIYGIAANVLDLPSMLFLPELLYRWSFPGKVALAQGCADRPPEEPGFDYLNHWKHEIWKLRTHTGALELEDPDEQEAAGDPLHWQPCNWYRPLWPRMTAFALPTYSEGLIRLNVRGRDGAGVLEIDDFSATCDAICTLLHSLTDSRTGRPMVREIVRTRRTPFDANRDGPPADLIVLWQEDTPTDSVDCPGLGRIGPVPHFRSGGHCSHGFYLTCGPDIHAGAPLPDLQAPDLTATMLDWLGQTVPLHVEGRPLREILVSSGCSDREAE